MDNVCYSNNDKFYLLIGQDLSIILSTIISPITLSTGYPLYLIVDMGTQDKGYFQAWSRADPCSRGKKWGPDEKENQ